MKYSEPLSTTLARTFIIALVAAAIASLWLGGVRRIPLLFLLMLWPSLGGHGVEILFLNWMRPRLPASATAQRLARVATWFVGGIILALGTQLTAKLIMPHPPARWIAWYMAGVGFILIELLAHAGLHRRGVPNFYNGRS